MQDLKQALRKLAKAVVVVTAKSGNERFAMSATAVSEVSLDPPTMLVCVNRNAAIHSAISSRGAFCLNILGQSHEEISRRCGGEAFREARFQVGKWGTTVCGVPFLTDAEATLICRRFHTCSIGTHDIFIGRIENVIVSDRCDPLLYMDGAYARAERREGPVRREPTH